MAYRMIQILNPMCSSRSINHEQMTHRNDLIILSGTRKNLEKKRTKNPRNYEKLEFWGMSLKDEKKRQKEKWVRNFSFPVFSSSLLFTPTMEKVIGTTRGFSLVMTQVSVRRPKFGSFCLTIAIMTYIFLCNKHFHSKRNRYLRNLLHKWQSDISGLVAFIS